jgi:hypothetical protein
VSAGHARPRIDASHYRELRRIAGTPWFQRGLAIKKVLIRSAEIPWLGGSSADLRRIYIDPRFTGSASYRSRTVNVEAFVPALVQHEGVEGILLVLGHDEAGRPYSYDGAHELATAAEEQKARVILGRLGLPWDQEAYQQIFKPFLKITVKPPWHNLPIDLNTIPYRDDDPTLYRQIERATLKRQLEIS